MAAKAARERYLLSNVSTFEQMRVKIERNFFTYFQRRRREILDIFGSFRFVEELSVDIHDIAKIGKVVFEQSGKLTLRSCVRKQNLKDKTLQIEDKIKDKQKNLLWRIKFDLCQSESKIEFV